MYQEGTRLWRLAAGAGGWRSLGIEEDEGLVPSRNLEPPWLREILRRNRSQKGRHHEANRFEATIAKRGEADHCEARRATQA